MRVPVNSLDATQRMLEGVLLRLARRPDAGGLVLRGGMLLRHWFQPICRPAQDLDLIAPAPLTVESAVRDYFPVFTDEMVVDGVVFDIDRLQAEAIWRHTDHPGVRVHASGILDDEELEFRVDITGGPPPRPAPTCALEPYEELAGRAVPLLHQMTRDPSPEVRTRTALTLMSLPTSVGGTPDPAWQLLRAGGESATQDLVDALRRIVHAVGPAETLLIELLDHSDEKIQKEAAYALSAKGPMVVPQLAAALKSVSATLRARVAETLGSFPPYCPAAVAALTEALRDLDPQVRSQAASALAQYEEEAAPALSALLAAHQDTDEDVRSSAGFALSKLGPMVEPALPVFIEALNSSDSDTRFWATSLLGQVEPSSLQAAVPRLIECLRDENVHVRVAAVETLRKLACAEESLVVHFIAALSDSEEKVRKEALAALTSLGPKAHAAVLALRKVPDSDALRSEVRIARVRCNDDVSDIVRELIPELKSKDQRDSALEVLEAIGPAARAVEPLLVELFNKSVRRAANLEDADFVKSWWEFGTSKDIARALWKITGRTDKFLPVATHLLRNGNVLVRGTMADVFKDMGPAAREAVPALADAMCNVHGDYVCTSAVDALCSLGPEARAAIPQMIQALSNQFLSSHAVRVLARIGAAAVPALIQALRQPQERTREFAADALGDIGPAADAAVDDLTALLQEDSDARWWAAYALARIRPTAAPLSILIAAVQSAPSDAREAAAVALAGLGESGAEALPALREALEDSSRTVRAAAWHAIKHITPSET